MLLKTGFLSLLVASHVIVSSAIKCEGLYFHGDHKNFGLLPHYPDCGLGYRQPKNIHTRIKGGQTPTLGEFPWIVHTKIYVKYEHKRCGGTLINDRYIISASHCYINTQFEPIKRVLVTLGDFFKYKYIDCEGSRCSPPAVINTVSHIYIDSKYSETKGIDNNDLAVLRLTFQVEFTEYVKPICLPLACLLAKASYDGVVMTVAGWGQKTAYEFSKELQKLSSQVVDYKQCSRLLWYKQVKRFSQCFIASRERGTCDGDSGGPVMLKVRVSQKCKCAKRGIEILMGGPHNVYYLMATTNYGIIPCFRGNRTFYIRHHPPKVQMRIVPLLKWILDRMKP